MKNKALAILQSKALALLLFALAIFLLILKFVSRPESWWLYADIFFLFLGAFCHLMAVTVGSMGGAPMRRKLDLTALFCLFLAIATGVAALAAGQPL